MDSNSTCHLSTEISLIYLKLFSQPAILKKSGKFLGDVIDFRGVFKSPINFSILTICIST